VQGRYYSQSQHFYAGSIAAQGGAIYDRAKSDSAFTWRHGQSIQPAKRRSPCRAVPNKEIIAASASGTGSWELNDGWRTSAAQNLFKYGTLLDVMYNGALTCFIKRRFREDDGSADQ